MNQPASVCFFSFFHLRKRRNINRASTSTGFPLRNGEGTGMQMRNAMSCGFANQPESPALHEAGPLLEELGGLAEERPPHCARRQAAPPAVPHLVPQQQQTACYHQPQDHAEHRQQKSHRYNEEGEEMEPPRRSSCRRCSTGRERTPPVI
jgi:hypothetical protein